jgi:hypothetical protein
MNTTAKLLGLCPLYKGLRLRLTAKLLGKENVVHDSVGTVGDIWLHERDQRSDVDWQVPAHGVPIAALRICKLSQKQF